MAAYCMSKYQISILKVICTTLLLFVIKINGWAQVKVDFGFGSANGYTQQSTRLIHSKNNLTHSGHRWLLGQGVLGLEYQPNKISYWVRYSQYKGTTMMRFSEFFSFGFYGSRIERYDLGISYDLLHSKKRLFFKPFAAIGIQISKKTGNIWGEQLNLHGPVYYQTEIPTSEGYNITQLVPSLGVQMGVAIAKKIDVGFRIQGVYGFKTYQIITLHYVHIDDLLTERTAVFDSTGTGLFPSLFVAFDLSNSHTKLPNQ